MTISSVKALHSAQSNSFPASAGSTLQFLCVKGSLGLVWDKLMKNTFSVVSFFSFIIYKSKAFISVWFKNVKWFCINVNKMIYKRYLKSKLWSFLLWEFLLASVGCPAGAAGVSWGIIAQSRPFVSWDRVPGWAWTHWWVSPAEMCSLCPVDCSVLPQCFSIFVLFCLSVSQSLFCYVVQAGALDPSAFTPQVLGTQM